MPVAVGVGEHERRYLGGGETMRYGLFSDTYEETELRDGGFIDLLPLNVDLPKPGGPKVRKEAAHKNSS